MPQYAVIQIIRKFDNEYDINLTESCFLMDTIFNSLEDAIIYKNKMAYPDWYIIIQTW